MESFSHFLNVKPIFMLKNINFFLYLELNNKYKKQNLEFKTAKLHSNNLVNCNKMVSHTYNILLVPNYQ